MKKELTDAVKLYGRNQNYLLMTSSDKYMGVRKHSFWTDVDINNYNNKILKI